MSDTKLEKKTRGRPKKDEDTDKLVLRIDLEKNLQEDFFKVKESQGLTNNTEVIRFCIREIASSKFYRIPETTFNIIDEIVKDPRIQDKYVLTSVEDFISRSIRQFIMKTRSDRSNLHDWDYRASLDTVKRDVANALVKLQSENKTTMGTTLEQLSQELTFLPQAEVQKSLFWFVSKHLVDQLEHNKITYYYAIDRGYMTDEPMSEY